MTERATGQVLGVMCFDAKRRKRKQGTVKIEMTQGILEEEKQRDCGHYLGVCFWVIMR